MNDILALDILACLSRLTFGYLSRRCCNKHLLCHKLLGLVCRIIRHATDLTGLVRFHFLARDVCIGVGRSLLSATVQGCCIVVGVLTLLLLLLLLFLIVDRVVAGKVRVGSRQMVAFLEEIGESGMTRAVGCLLRANFKEASSKIVRNILHFLS